MSLWSGLVLLAAPLVGWLIAGFIVRWPERRGLARHGPDLRYERLILMLAAVGVTGWALWIGEGWRGPMGAVLAWGLLALGWMDARYFHLPDVLTLLLVGVGLLSIGFFEPALFWMHLAGAVVGFCVFWLINRAYVRLRGREGLGGGDAKLLAASGAWLGLMALPQIVLLGSVLALVWTLVPSLIRSAQIKRDQMIPFGAYLATATWIIWVFSA